MRIYPATIRSCCFLHSLRSFAKTNSVKNGKKNPVSNAQTTHVAWETAPKVYCQQRSRGAFCCACAKKKQKMNDKYTNISNSVNTRGVV